MSQTIKDRRGCVTIMLSNRSDLAQLQSSWGPPFDTRPPIDKWLGDAYVDAGFSYNFDELNVGPLLIQTPGDSVTQYSPLPDDLRAIDQVSIDIDGNGKYVPMNPTDYKVIRRTTSVSPGRPTRYGRHGLQIWWDRIPDRLYNVQLSYWQKPELVIDPSNTNSDVEDTQLLLADDWFEILDRMAAMRGWEYLQDAMKMSQIKTELFGDPSDPRKGPGLIKAKMTATIAESSSSEYGITPVIIPTCWVR